MPKLSGILLAATIAALPFGGIIPTHAASRNAAPIVLTEEDYYQGGAGGTPQLNDAMNKIISDYEKGHPGVTIKRTTLGFADLFGKVQQQALSHTLPDITILDNPQMAAIAGTGVLADLDPYTKSWSQYKDYYRSSLDTCSLNGKLYGIPVGNNDLALWYNKDLFKKAGIASPPRDWAEMRADAKKLTAGKVAGFLMSAKATEDGAFQFEPFLWGNGADLLKLAAPQSVEALTYVTQLLKDGSMPKSVLTWDQGLIWNQFVAGNAAMEINGPWNLADPLAKKVNFGLAYVPRKTASMPPVSPLGGEVWTITASQKARQDAAWDFLKFTQDIKNLVPVNEIQGYLPAYKPANALVVKANPDLAIFNGILPTSKARASVLGKNYPQASDALTKALQAALTGQQTPQQAMQAAQDTISGLNSQ